MIKLYMKSYLDNYANLVTEAASTEVNFRYCFCMFGSYLNTFYISFPVFMYQQNGTLLLMTPYVGSLTDPNPVGPKSIQI